MQNLVTYIQHPEYVNAATIDELRLLVDSYPYYHAARLVMLRAMYQQQDDRFGSELRQAAIFLPDRARLYQLTEGTAFATMAGHKTVSPTPQPATAADAVAPPQPAQDRTVSLIDSFLDQLPEPLTPRRPHAVDASVDYISYLMASDSPDTDTPRTPTGSPTKSPSKKPSLTAPSTPLIPANDGDELTDQKEASDDYFTETLARIYIKQGKYSKAIEIIRRLNLNFPEKNRYFADQIRFLEKLILNENARQEEK